MSEKKERFNYSTNTKWEEKVAYSRAVRIGNIVEVSGTTAVDDNGKLVGQHSVYQQTVFVLSKIQKSMEACGADIKDVIRTRIFISDISKWEEAGQAHREFFKDIKPCTTMVEVKLINEDLLVEIEASAVIG